MVFERMRRGGDVVRDRGVQVEGKEPIVKCVITIVDLFLADLLVLSAGEQIWGQAFRVPARHHGHVAEPAGETVGVA